MPDSEVFQNQEKLDLLNKQIVKQGYCLEIINDAIQLVSLTEKFKPLVIDWVEGKQRHRRLYGGGRNQPLAKAVGIKASNFPQVFDMTAGMGRDAFVLASLGCDVHLFERSAVIAVLLEDALQRARLIPELDKITQRMQFCEVDSQQHLSGLEAHNYPDVIYLDPMYPHRDKSALVKKEMRIFRDLVGDDADAENLFELARKKIKKRLVVKRPKGAEYLVNEAPDFQVSSKNTRFDCYLPNA